MHEKNVYLWDGKKTWFTTYFNILFTPQELITFNLWGAPQKNLSLLEEIEVVAA